MISTVNRLHIKLLRDKVETLRGKLKAIREENKILKEELGYEKRSNRVRD